MISVTLLSAYHYCKRKLFLEKVLKIVPPPKEVMVRGSIRHNCFDSINKLEQGIVTSIIKPLPKEEIFDVYKAKYSKALRNAIIMNKRQISQLNLEMNALFKELLPPFIVEARRRADNILGFIEKNNIFGSELWESLVPKIKSELRIESKELNLKGIIDEALVYPDRILPIELKTGKMPDSGVWDSNKIQLGAYIMLLRKEYKSEVSEGIVRYLDFGEERTVSLNPFLEHEILDLRDKVMALLNSKEIPPYCRPDTKCRNCSLKDKCYDGAFIKEKLGQLVTTPHD
ncbi:CRISPR-associated protein Cas4 [Candidatus Woesearchaeota archaeon]|nr:CRISPR-associated protein Cas4 [Candidatus Woesearchaeota archaeon]